MCRNASITGLNIANAHSKDPISCLEFRFSTSDKLFKYPVLPEQVGAKTAALKTFLRHFHQGPNSPPRYHNQPIVSVTADNVPILQTSRWLMVHLGKNPWFLWTSEEFLLEFLFFLHSCIFVFALCHSAVTRETAQEGSSLFSDPLSDWLIYINCFGLRQL